MANKEDTLRDVEIVISKSSGVGHFHEAVTRNIISFFSHKTGEILNREIQKFRIRIKKKNAT